jgi:uncharacterized protein (DUF1810 family)
MTDPDLRRFVNAQSTGEFDTALAEMTAGRKRSHWIWFVFPQLAGLGTSDMARRYAIRDRDEAIAYLRDPLLAARLLEITTAVAEQVRQGAELNRLMGSAVDATKLVSSLTLFGHAARALNEAGSSAHAPLAGLADEILAAAAAQGYAPCRHTLERLGAAPPRPGKIETPRP